MSAQAAASARAAGSGRTAGIKSTREGWILAVCCVAQFMVILDLSIVNVALPHIQSALSFSSPELQWVIDAYSIVFAGFLMFGGRASDRFGQRRVFVAAMLLFGVASLIGGVAQDKDMLIAARALQGLAGAFMAAGSLAIITASFPPGPKLHKAIGTWAAMNGLGGAAGVLLGGIITEALSWRWVLLINPPIGIATAIVAYAVVSDRRRSEAEGSFDLAGAFTLTVGQMVLVYGVVEAGLRGWDAPIAIGPIIGGAVLLLAFGVIESRFASNPLVPLKELTKTLKVANTVVLLFSASLFAMWFTASLYLQQVLGLSPLHTGLTFLPMTLMIMLFASQAGKLVGRFGVRAVLGTGLIMLAGGLVLLARIGPTGSGIVYVMVPGLLVAAGIGMSIVPSTIAATQGAKPGQAGLASGIVNTARQVGAGLGLAVLGTLSTQATTHLIGSGNGVLVALTHGFRLAFIIGAGCVALAAIITFTLLPSPHAPRGETAGAGEPAGAAPAGSGAQAGAVGQAGGGGQAGAGASATAGARRFGLGVGVATVIVVFIAANFAFGNSKGAPLGAYKTDGAYSFVTMPDIHPPKIVIEGKPATDKFAPGYIFTANFFDVSEPPLTGQSGPLILDNRLKPVWFKAVPEKDVASNLSLQTYGGKPALSWWQGVVTSTGATESGEDIVANDHYQTVARLKGVNGWKLTMHEMIVTGGSAWVTAEKNIPYNLSKYGGAYNGALIDSAVQEYDLKSGKLLRSWDALKHIPLSESEASIPTNGFPWDAYHVNSIQLLSDDSFIVSMRDTWAAYLVNMKSGKIKWTLGGKRSSFKIARNAAFRWQHDVRLHPGGVVTMFDDHCCQLTGGGTYVKASAPSRGLVLKLNEGTHTASRVADYGIGYGLESDYMGDLQPLPNGNVMVGWGSEPYLSELTKSEQPVLEGKFPGSDLSYRVTVQPWVGLPLYPPDGAARAQGAKTTVYASWNGATQLASWRVLASDRQGSGEEADASATGAGTAGGAAGATTDSGTASGTAGASATSGGATSLPSGYEVVGSAPKSGFETAIAIAKSHKRFVVQALDGSGKVIGTSKPFTTATAK